MLNKHCGRQHDLQVFFYLQSMFYEIGIRKSFYDVLDLIDDRRYLYLQWILHITPKTGAGMQDGCAHEYYLILQEMFQYGCF